ncbi:hypothetical protein RBSH_02732 [Rhodopirellula baltica SH28]|uniref:Uncharacterized protein n=2 Tax=Rhodopirellula baltica TaxID=265606 RepID=F2B188_RHOBT|nr:hypothetical protein RBWH47_00076 [Rhodopirellula baltica WH47]EKK01966.1 hypothetical protein RBSH_02732 [Rhodopirellula baltica SH28]
MTGKTGHLRLFASFFLVGPGCENTGPTEIGFKTIQQGPGNRPQVSSAEHVCPIATGT